MKTIPRKQTDDLDLHALRVLDVLFRERSLTRAAETLHTQQPALSKTLARLRRYFNDPLFVRVSLHMEPTAKAHTLNVGSSSQARRGLASSACTELRSVM